MNSSHAPAAAVQSCSRYEPKQVRRVIEEVWSQASMESVRGLKVLVKPNMLFDAPPEKAVCTHPEVVSALLQLLLDLGARPTVGDSPAVHTSSFTGELSGIRQVCRKLGVPWADFLDGTVKVSSKVPGTPSKSFTVSRHAAACDLIVSAAKMKTHQLMYLTGAVKNLFGVIPSFTKSSFHLRHPRRKEFGEFLTHLNSALPPSVGVIDGITAMEGPGPNNGHPRHAGFLIASKDCCAADAAAAMLIGSRPQDIPSCAAMHRLGLSPVKTVHDIHFPLLDPKDHVIETFVTVPRQNHLVVMLKITMARVFSKQRTPPGVPKIALQRCISCGKCAMICPNGSAARQEDGIYSISSRTCIRCYCCDEVCPADAIEIRR